MIVKSDFWDEDLLFRFTVCRFGDYRVLGIIEDVYVVSDRSLGQFGRRLKIRNLLLWRRGSKASPIRIAPTVGKYTSVYFPSDDDLAAFFPRDPRLGCVGCVRGTNYPMPLDFDRLCFGNTAILAGIGHGKSHIAAQIAAQLSLMGKKVLIVDPTGEWTDIIANLKAVLNKSARVKLSVSPHFVQEVDHQEVSPGEWVPLWKERKEVFDSLRRNDLTILDVSFAKQTSLKAEEKLSLRCEIIEEMQQTLMRVAQKEYDEKRVPYAYQTCIFLEESHEFVPPKYIVNAQQKLSTLFSISTKEYRKYGLGHVFIDQSLKAISEDLQIQTFLLGATTTPADLSFLESRLGKDVFGAVQRTAGSNSWVALGAATPMASIPWEITSFKPEDLSLLLEGAPK